MRSSFSEKPRRLTFLWIALICALVWGAPGRCVACIDYGEYAHQIAYRDLPEDVSVAAMAGSFLYLAGTTVFYVFDLSDGNDPRKVGSLALAEDPRAIAVSGSYAYIASGAGGLTVIRIADPNMPILVAQLDLGVEALDVAVSGDCACIAAGQAGMFVVSIGDPTKPRVMGSIDTPGVAQRLDVEGALAYVADRTDLKVISIEDPRHPEIVGTARWSGTATDVAVRDGRAYVADAAWGLQIVDISIPGIGRPRVQRVVVSGGASRVNVAGDTAFVLNGTDFNSTLTMIDTATSSPPAVSGQVTVRGSLHDFCVDERYACVAGGWYGYSIVDVSPPGSPGIIGHLNGPTGALAVTVRGNYAYMGYPYWTYLWIADISDPSHPRLRGSVQGTPWGAAIGLIDNYAIIAGRSTGIHVVDVADPDHPFRVGTYGLAGHPSNVAIYGQCGLFSSGTLWIVDFSNPADPRLVGSIVPPGGVGNVQITGHYACTAGNQTINMIDLTDLSYPVVSGSLVLGRSLRGVAVSGDLVFVATSAGFYVVDVSDPTNLRLLADVPDAYFCDGISALGSHVYVCGNHQGILIFDVTDPTHPVQCGSMDTPNYAYTAAVTPDYTYEADGDYGLYVVHTQCEGQRDAPASTDPLDGEVKLWLGLNRPNPFHSSTTIEFALTERANVALQVFSASGRLVRTLARGEYEPGRWWVTWDGTTDAGRMAPRGVYSYRIREGTRSLDGRMVFLK